MTSLRDFRVGDEVVCIEDDFGFNVGDFGVIRIVALDGDFKLVGNDHWRAAHRWKRKEGSVTEFKRGDEVVCIHCDRNNKPGDSGIVSFVDDDGTFKLTSGLQWLWTAHWKRKEDSMPKFKMGDKVVCIDEDLIYEPGDTGTVDFVDNDGTFLLTCDTRWARMSCWQLKEEPAEAAVNETPAPVKAEPAAAPINEPTAPTKEEHPAVLYIKERLQDLHDVESDWSDAIRTAMLDVLEYGFGQRATVKTTAVVTLAEITREPA